MARMQMLPRAPGIACAVFLFFILPARCEQGTLPAPKPPAAPVVLAGHELLSIHARVGSFTAAERATMLSSRLERLARDRTISMQMLDLAETDGGVDIVTPNQVLLTVTPADAAAVGKTPRDLAAEWLSAIREGIDRYRREYSTASLLRGLAYGALATLVLLLALSLLRRGFRALQLRIEAWRGTHIRALRIQRLELVSGDRLCDALLLAARGAHLLTGLTIVLVYLSALFALFPATRGYAGRALDQVVVALRSVVGAIASYLPSVAFLLVVIAVAFASLRLIKLAFGAIEAGSVEIPGFYRDWAIPTYRIVRFFVIVVALIAMFPYVPGSESPAFKGITIFLGAVVSLGSSSAVSNVLAGVVLTYTRAFQIGDRVQIGDAVGDVIAKTLLVTRIRTIKNVDVTIPNSQVLGSQVSNFSARAGEGGLILHTTVTIGYDAPWRRVHEILITAARATPGILQDPLPFVLQTSLDDFYVSYEINAYTVEPARMAQIYSEFHAAIQDAFNRAGVEICSPHYRALRDGNSVTIPEAERGADYVAPSFRVSEAGPVAPPSKPGS